MRSLFVKIFLWFWIATIVIIGATLVFVSLIEPYRPVREDGRLMRRLTRNGHMAVQILESEGTDALRRFISMMERRPGTHLYVLNDKSETWTGRQAPSEVKDLAARTRESGGAEFKRLDKSILLSKYVYGSNEKSYIVVSELPYRRRRFSPLWLFLNPRFLSVRLLVIFVVASIFCYWLAWYLTAPVRKLRKAAQQLASGNLRTRVIPDLGRRKDELSDLGRDFDVMAERIESLMTAQSGLLRDISHELRSPLARLNVALELARQRSGEKAKEPLDRIEREAERLNELIAQLRTLTVLESGVENMEKTRLDLSRLVQKITEDADFEARNRKRSVKGVLNDGIMIDGSEELLHRAIENVVRNAVRYTAEDTEVEISVTCEKTNSKEHAVVKVRDRGQGVPESALQSLFQPFYRIADARDRQTGGTGIGLAITERAVRLHGGTAKAENHPEGGLVIIITLPA